MKYAIFFLALCSGGCATTDARIESHPYMQCVKRHGLYDTKQYTRMEQLCGPVPADYQQLLDRYSQDAEE